MTILIVDDNRTNRKLLNAQIGAEGHTVLEAANGKEALSMLEREIVHAIISDILMPQMDGFRLCHEVRTHDNFKTLPFLIYSATYTSPSDQRLAQQVGADAYLTKPASSKQLFDALDEATQKAKRRRTTITTASTEDQLYVMKEYNVALVNKLEDKNAELEQTFETVQRAHERIIELNKELEHRVQERTAQLTQANKELQETLNQVKTLSGLLPICSNCKKIRNDDGYWVQVEAYLMQYTKAEFTHGICEDCGRKLYGDQFPIPDRG